MCIWMWYSRTEHGKAFVAGCKAEAKAKEAEKKAKEAEAKAKAVAELASKKKEYMRYAKDIDDIANYPTKFQNENMWLTYSDNEKSPECAVNKICADYQLVKNHREEYFDWTKELMDIMGNFKDANLKPMQNSENEITKIFKQFEKNYKYDDDKPSVLVFRDSLKNIINAMKMRRKTADFMIKKGENFEGLSDAEEFFLIQANNMLQLIDEKIKENKENADIAERKKILQELDNIKCAQQEQQWIATQQGKELQHILKTGKPRGFLDIIFDVHEYKD